MSMNNMNDQLEQAQDYKGRVFVGRVTADQDPTGKNRFKAVIPGLFEDGELPWIGFAKDSPFGIGKGFGVYGSPHVGSTALIEFQDGDINYGICVGFIITEADKDPEFADGRVWGYKDPNGTKLVVNTVDKSYRFVHVSGTEYLIDKQGNLTALVKNNASVTVDGNTIVHTKGNTTVNTDGSTTVNTGGNTVINTSGTTQVISGQAVSVQAPTVTIDSPETTVMGKLTVHGLLSFLGGIFGRGGSGGQVMDIEGDINHRNGTLVSNGVGLHTHIHPTPEGDSGPPRQGT